MTVTNPRPLQAVLDGVELESGGLGGNPGMDGGASAGGADQQPSPSGGKDSSLSKGRSGSGRVDTLTGQVAAARAAVATGAWG